MALSRALNVLRVEEYGLNANGTTDDSAAVQACMNQAIANVQANIPTRVVFPAASLKINTGLTLAATSNITVPLDIEAYGTLFVSGITNGADVLKISITTGTALWRYFTLRGLHIYGNNGKANLLARDGNCIKLSVESSANAFYNFSFQDLKLEQAGASGMSMTGAIFEGTIRDCFFADNLFYGLNMDNGSGGGILSAMHIYGCSMVQNVQFGCATGSPNDFNFYGCYFRTNGQNGGTFGNGFKLMSGCGFEQNCTAGGGGNNVFGFIATSLNCLVIGTNANNVGFQTKLMKMFMYNATNCLSVISCATAGSADAGLGNVDANSADCKVLQLGNVGTALSIATITNDTAHRLLF